MLVVFHVLEAPASTAAAAAAAAALRDSVPTDHTATLTGQPKWAVQHRESGEIRTHVSLFL
jgi:hypothetical protein